MLAFARASKHVGALNGLAQLAARLSGEGPAAAALQQCAAATATRSLASSSLTDLRLFSPGLQAPASLSLGSSAAHWQPHTLVTTAHRFSTSAARQQDDQAAGVNPLQSVPGAAVPNPLSAIQSPAGPGRDLITSATLRNTKISPYKLNDFVRIIRRLHVDDALLQCHISVKKSARLVKKLLESARANGVQNHGLDPSRLVVDNAQVGKAKYLKRTDVKGRGRSGVRHKHRSHMTIKLREFSAGEAPRRITRVIQPLLVRRRKNFAQPTV